jgi:3-methyladenine DNA glycosylase/8-oxoguanine DNA glycosylase
VGVWTAAEVAVRALGDPDAVSFGDYHLAANVVHALTGEPDGDDDRLTDLLAPYAGQRYRLVRMVELSMPGRPRRGPRYSPLDLRRF